MAQVDNAADSDSEDRGFESLRAGQELSAEFSQFGTLFLPFFIGFPFIGLPEFCGALFLLSGRRERPSGGAPPVFFRPRIFGFAKFAGSVMNGMVSFGKELADMQKTRRKAGRRYAPRTDKGKDNVICFVGGDQV